MLTRMKIRTVLAVIALPLCVLLAGCGGGGSSSIPTSAGIDLDPGGSKARVAIRFAGIQTRQIRTTGSRQNAVVRIAIRGISVTGQAQPEQHEELPVDAAGNAEGTVECTPGKTTFGVQIDGGDIENHAAFGGCAELAPGPNVVAVAPGDDDWETHALEERVIYQAYDGLNPVMTQECASDIAQADFGWLTQIAASAATDAVMRECVLDGNSLNFFDDIKLYNDSTVFVDESFDSYADLDKLQVEGGTVSSLENLWSGKAGYVTHFTHAPNSGPACWVSRAYPGSNRQDGVDITPAQAGSNLTFEARILVTDVQKGVTIGLARPYGGFQEEMAFVVFRDGKVFVCSGEQGSTSTPPSSFTGLAAFEALRWYALKARCDLNAHTMDMWLDGAQIGDNEPMLRSPTNLYNFTTFGFAGTYFAN
jgi:hypothetical protein